MPAGIAAKARKAPPTLALCLQLTPRLGSVSRLVSCSLATNFGCVTQHLAPEADPPAQGLPGNTPVLRDENTTVLVIHPVALPRTPQFWQPSLSHLLALALHKAGVSPAQFQDEPLTVALYGRSPDGRALRQVFHPVLPACPFPAWLRLRVCDMAGRTFALRIWTVDINRRLGDDGLDRLADVILPLLEPGVSRKEREERKKAAGLADLRDPAVYAEWAAQQARLALFFTRDVLSCETTC